MHTGDTSYRRAAEFGFPADTEPRTPPQPYRIPRDYPPQRPSPRPARDDLPPQRHYQVPFGYPPLGPSRQVSRRTPEAPAAFPVPSRTPGAPPAFPVPRRIPEAAPTLLTPAPQLRMQEVRRQYRIRQLRTWPQRIGGVLIVGACVVSVLWYVPRVIADDHRLLTGTVTSSGVVTLNFTSPGEISRMEVRLGDTVRKGQVLAAEYDPDAALVVAADNATIASEKAKIAELKAAAAADPAAAPADNAQIATDKAQITVDEAQLATDRTKIAAAEILAPSSGIVIAANGQPGETVTASGIRDFATDSQQAATTQNPQFSLFPEGPQATRRTPASGSDLPVIALRTSTTWQVVTLIPEGSVSGIKPGRKVTISVPAAHIKDVPGQIDEIVPTPAATSAGVFYQAVVTITGHAMNLPMNGMAADIQLVP